MMYVAPDNYFLLMYVILRRDVRNSAIQSQLKTVQTLIWQEESGILAIKFAINANNNYFLILSHMTGVTVEKLRHTHGFAHTKMAEKSLLQGRKPFIYYKFLHDSC